jgi:hypothetical protein
MRQPDFDLDKVIGDRAEKWVAELRELLGSQIEVKAPKPGLRWRSFFIEYQCRWQDGKWYPSGIATSKAEYWCIKFGDLPGALFVETEWLRRAARLARQEGKKQSCDRGDNPTKGALVGLEHLWRTKIGEP